MSSAGDAPPPGKKSPNWRQGSQTPSAKDPRPNAGKSPAGGDRFAPLAGKRFQARAASRGQGQTPLWYRVFFPAAGLTVTVAALLIFLFWAAPRTKNRPLLVSWAVTDYADEGIPLNAFALDDVRAILATDRFSTGSSAGITQDTTNLQTQQSFQIFFERSLKEVTNDTIVIHLSAHGVSDAAGGYLLHAESTCEPHSGYPIDEVLRHVAACPAKNKLLILDATRVGSSLDLGMLGNDFVHHLREQFQAAASAMRQANPDHSFWVLCSSSDGEPAFASRELRHSIFGLCVAYGLHGGSDVDRKADEAQADGILTVDEFTRFVRDRVSGWASRHRNVRQTPLILHEGSDFPLLESESTVTMQSVVALGQSPQEGAAEAPADNPGPKESETAKADAKAPKAPDGEVAKKADPKEAPADEPKGKEGAAPPTDGELLAQIVAGWKARESLAKTPIPQRRPGDWQRWTRLLLLAEQRLIARESADLAKLLSGPIREIQQSLAGEQSVSVMPTWSLASLTPGQDKDPLLPAQEAIDAFVEKPEDPKSLEPFRLVESDLLRFLHRQLVPAAAWSSPDVVAMAVRTRTQSERSAMMSDPALLDLLKDGVDEGDLHQRRGVVALLNARATEARSHLQRAQDAYELSSTDSAELAAQARQLREIVSDALGVVRWLGQDPADRVGRSADLAKLDRFLEELSRFERQPTRQGFRTLTSLGDDLRQQGTNYAQNAWQRPSWQQASAALALTFLDAPLRERLLRMVLELKDGLPGAGEQGSPPATEGGPGNPYPLARLVACLGGEQGLQRDLDEFDPSRSDPISFGRIVSDVSLRRRRADAGQNVRALLARPVSDGVSNGSDRAWESDLSTLMTASIVERVAGTAAVDKPMAAIRTGLQGAWSAWLAGRLLRDEVNLPGPCFEPIARTLAPAKDVRALSATLPGASFVELPVATIEVPTSGPAKHTMTLRARRPIVPDSSIVFDWYRHREQLAIESRQGSPEDARVRIPLFASQPDQTQEIALAMRWLGKPPESGVTVVPWIEHADGRHEWLAPLRLTPKKEVLPPLQLIVERTRVRLYPNQSIGFLASIRKNVPEAMSARLEIDAGGPAGSIIELAYLDKSMGVFAVPVPEGLSLPVPTGEMRFRLFLPQTDAPLDEARIAVDVLDPTDFLRADAQYDPQKRRVQIRLTRETPSDSPEPIALRLNLDDVVVKQGVLEAEMGPSDASVVLEAQVPDDVLDEALLANVSAAGVPRILRFLLGASRPRGTLQRSVDLEITQPRPGDNFLQSTQLRGIGVALNADGPPGSKLRVELGIDRNANTLLERSESISAADYWAGRQVATRLVRAGTPPTFRIENQVSDIEIPIASAGLLGEQTIVARVIGGTESRTASARIHFLREAPTVALASPESGLKVPQGTPVPVLITADPDFFRAIGDVQFGFDLNGDGKWDEAETARPVGRSPNATTQFGANNQLEVILPTKGIPVGPTYLMTRSSASAIDPTAKEPRVVLTSPTVFRQILVVEPAAEKKESAPPKFGTIAGVVTVGAGGVPKKGAKVTIAGLGETLSGDRGMFLFEKVPPGSYTVQADTPGRTGKSTITVEAGHQAEVEVPITLK